MESVPDTNRAPEADGTVRLFPDGTYRWICEVNMYKDTFIIGTLLKVAVGVVVGIWFVLGIADGFENFLQNLTVMLIFLGSAVALVLLSYLIIALVRGGKYKALYEMDEKGIDFTQLPREVRNPQAVANARTVADLVGGKLGSLTKSVLADQTNSIETSFEKVRSIRPCPKKHLIRLNAPMSNNRIYTREDDYQFILDYILLHCPQARQK